MKGADSWQSWFNAFTLAESGGKTERHSSA